MIERKKQTYELTLTITDRCSPNFQPHKLYRDNIVFLCVCGFYLANQNGQQLLKAFFNCPNLSPTHQHDKALSSRQVVFAELLPLIQTQRSFKSKSLSRNEEASQLLL